MKRIVIASVVMLLLFALAAQAQTPAPQPGPEHRALGVLVGTWEAESENKLTGAKSKGSQACDWESGGVFVVCRNKLGTISILGYSREDKIYTVYIYSSTTGGSSFGKGWVRGNNWTYVFENERADGKQRRRQYTSQMSPTSYSYKWERSIEGEPWVVTSEGKGTKVK